MATLIKRWDLWLHGLIGAVIGGAANAVVAMFVDPVAFNFSDLNKLGKLALGGAIISLAFYLKKSPVPPVYETPDTTITTSTGPTPPASLN